MSSNDRVPGMLQKLQQTKLVYRLILIGIVPMIAVAFFATVDLSRLLDRRAANQNVAELVHVSTAMANVVHELQRERGLSAGFVSSRGGKFAQELRAQRDATDARIVEMEAVLSDAGKDLETSSFASGVAELREQLAGLGELRGQIDAFGLEVPQLAPRYTAPINTILATINHIAGYGRGGESAMERNAFLLLLHGKEHAGLERAMGATGYAEGKFRNPVYKNLTERIALQNNSIRKSREFASDKDIAMLDALADSPATRAVQAMRDSIHASINGAELQGNAAQWWDATSRRIDELKEIENFMAEEITAEAQHDLAETNRMVMEAVAVFTTILVLLAAVLSLVARSILRPLHNVTHTMREMGAGRLTGEPNLPEGRNELGRLGDTVRAFREKLAATEAERDEQEREKQIQTEMIAGSIGSGLAALAEGDLTYRVQASLDGPLASLKNDFNRSVESLEALISKALVNIEQISTGSREISQASEDLARRTESNAASLEETTAAIANLDAQLKETAEAARATFVRTAASDEAVRDGRSIAGAAAQSMQGVSESAKGIDAVIEGLDKIAFQTRVLAMNAAVEAGRAGEAGRGFAVVADLVAALAMRAEEEAGNAREQLTATQEEIERAVVAVDRVDGSLENIAGNMSEVHRLVDSIARANAGQAEVVTEINGAMQQMDQATQQNAAMVEQTSAAARNLRAEAAGLRSETDHFKVGESASVPPMVAHRPAAGGGISAAA